MSKLKSVLAALTIAALVVVLAGTAVLAVTSALNMGAGDTEAVSCPNVLTTADSTPNSLTLHCAPDTTTTALPDTTTTVPVTTTTVPVTTTTTAPPAAKNVAFYGDSLTGDYYWHGYIGNGLAADLTANGFGPTFSLKGCGGMSLAQFVGRTAPDGAPQDAACKTANTLTAHTASIAGSSTVVVAFVTNDWPYTPAQFEADMHTAISRIETLNPAVRHIVFIKNFMTGTHSADEVTQAARENTAIVKVLDLSGAYGGNYGANCQNPANQNHPTDACWKLLAANVSAQLKGLG